LIGMRHKFSFLLSSFSVLKEESKKLNLKSLSFEIKKTKEIQKKSIIHLNGNLFIYEYL